jgi:V8-like Glu-specific endopeptidase
MEKLFAEIFSPAVLLALGFCCTVGCGDLQRNSGHDGGYSVSVSNWKPEAVRIQCTSKDCPEGVGAVIFAQNIGGAYRLQRCTATLIDSEHILANSHCGKAFSYDSAYFFVNAGGRTIFYSVGNRVFDREEGLGLEAGMGADLAVFQLNGSVSGVEPRRVSRRVPENMSMLIGYKIDEPNSDSFVNLKLNKIICTTTSRQPLFGGGTDDMNLGLALFGCDIQHGNSGAPLFVSGNMRDVQVIVNTSYPFHSQPGSNKLDALFAQRPLFLNENFAMGNRVQCMEIEGQPSAAVDCSRATVDEQIRKPFQSGSVRIARERLTQLNADSTAVWGLRVFKMKVKRNPSDKFPKSGMVLMPYPVCMKSTATSGDLGVQQVQYLTLDMNPNGQVTSHIQHVETLKGHFEGSFPMSDKFDVSFARDYRTVGTYEPMRFEGGDPQAMSVMEVRGCTRGSRAEIRDDEPTVIPQYLIR